jgi:hypothetical protein
MRPRRLDCSLAGFLLVALLTGCVETAPNAHESSAAAPATMGSHFDPNTSGIIRGQVTWTGDVPTVAPYAVPPLQFGLVYRPNRWKYDNVNVPQVDASRRGAGDLVVFLRGIDPGRARPWDHKAVEVEQADFRLNVRQGEAVSRIGFVRRGDPVTMISRQPVFHSLHGDGADFFSLAFADPNRPCQRTLKSPGIVELSSAANYYWMRGYLFVVEHPYYTRTDREGRFELKDVPAGHYEIVCWAPSWIEDHHHRDPESLVISRMYYRPAVEHVRSLTVSPGSACEVSFMFGTADFQRD